MPRTGKRVRSGQAGAERLMQAERDGRMEVVVVYQLDRLARDPSELMQMLRDLNRLGVGFLTTSMREPESRGG